jgi:hypothetical protein
MLEAVVAGATDPEIVGVEVVRRPALTVSPVEMLEADGYLLGSPVNLGYISGGLKVAFDVSYYVIALTHSPRHEFWPDSVSFTDFELQGVIGHRQVTDGYLAQLARANRGRLATFDRGLVALHPDIAELVSTTP